MAIPTDISNLKVWFKADGTLWQDAARTTPAVTDGDPIGSWDDASGNANHAQQSTSGFRPQLKTSILNGLPVIRFDGTDDFLDGLSSIHTHRWFVVAKIPHAGFEAEGLITGGSGEDFVLIGDSSSTSQLCWYPISGPGTSSYRRQGIDLGATFDLPLGPMNAFYYMVVANTGVGGGWTTVPRFGVDRGNGGLGVERFGDWDIAEIFAYDADLSGPEVVSMETYLSNKYFVGTTYTNLFYRRHR